MITHVVFVERLVHAGLLDPREAVLGAACASVDFVELVNTGATHPRGSESNCITRSMRLNSVLELKMRVNAHTIHNVAYSRGKSSWYQYMLETARDLPEIATGTATFAADSTACSRPAVRYHRKRGDDEDEQMPHWRAAAHTIACCEWSACGAPAWQHVA
ncbi:unnamed protein product [Prorocentrum cordatum]|uniref:Uncharacterized protein n=1 Tax=Prorocentrum cordatum TaxID=2364126 RepID=A0ABN9TW89_9DINO|nr:unnamed protein product [Polarella glacialis]